MTKHVFLTVLAALALAGCKTPYTWTSSVPDGKRTVCVPTFRNESDVTELGTVVSRQVLREFQREGTFRLAKPESAAVEVQGVIRSSSTRYEGGGRNIGNRMNNYRFSLRADVSVVDRIDGKVVIDNRTYVAETVFASTQDLMSSYRDASGRLAEEVARQIVDDVLAHQW